MGCSRHSRRRRNPTETRHSIHETQRDTIDFASRASLGRWLPSLVVIALATPPCPADTYPRQPGIDALHYTYRLALRDEGDEIEGKATC